LNYLCEGWKTFFRHIDHPLKILGWLMQRGYPAPELMRVLAMEGSFARAGRNDPCPAAAGFKFKRCHGLKKKGPEKRDRKQVKHGDQTHSGPSVRS
jgi:uncharacterized protein